MAVFEVVAMALAPERHVAAFVDHFRRKGAARVRIYFDGPRTAAPSPDAVGLAEGELIVCDDAFWSAQGGRPETVEGRQRVVYDAAYRSLIADWLLVVDIDERLFGAVSPAAVLDAVPADYESVVFETVEAVWKAGDDLNLEYGASLARKSYSGPFWSELSHGLYPGAGKFFVRGLLGHHMGKHAVRRGVADLTVCIHESKRGGVPLKAARARDPSTGRPAWLLHYDAISLDAWRVKWDRRLAVGDTAEFGRRRRRQQADYAEARTVDKEAVLFERLYALTSVQAWVLRRLGLLMDIPTACRPTKN